MVGMMGGHRPSEAQDPLSNLVKLLADPAAFKTAVDEHVTAADKHAKAAAEAREALVDVHKAQTDLQAERDRLAGFEASLHKRAGELDAKAAELTDYSAQLASQRHALDAAVLKLSNDRKANQEAIEAEKVAGRAAVQHIYEEANQYKAAVDSKLAQLEERDNKLKQAEATLAAKGADLDKRLAGVQAAETEHRQRKEALRKVMGL